MSPINLPTVLIVDDERINRTALAELLKDECRVVLAKDGVSALQRVAEERISLILLDASMPDMDGYEVLRRLRGDPQTAHIAIIFISGLDRPEDEANGLKMGASDYIVKPFNQTVVMARVALHLQVVRQRRMLERLANIDGLTELANRRRFDEVYEQEWQRACQSGLPLSLALLDIDAFKQFNDRYGHPAGDRALRSVARTAGAAMHRPGDLAARYGGEELLLLMPETDAQSAHAIAEALRAAIAGLAIPHEASSVAPVLTVSIGGATFDPAGTEQPFELFEAADAQLYRAKQAGRDQVWWRALALATASA